jgi:hypothetical protein
MIRRALLAIVAAVALAGAPARAAGVETAPHGGSYKKLGDLAALPSFTPGLGTLYVDPATLPEGPFLAYDRAGRLVSTIYMVPLKTFETHMRLDGLAAPGGRIDHIDLSYDAGHPGAEEPHYRIVMWHVTKEEAARVAR